jgi:hypothetical protein
LIEIILSNGLKIDEQGGDCQPLGFVRSKTGAHLRVSSSPLCRGSFTLLDGKIGLMRVQFEQHKSEQELNHWFALG